MVVSCKKSETSTTGAAATASGAPATAAVATGAVSSATIAAPDTVALWIKVSNIRAAWKGFAHYAHADESSPDQAFSQLFQGEALKLLKLDGPLALALPVEGMNSPSPVFALDVGDYSAAKNAFKTTQDGEKLHVNGILTSAGGPGVICDLVNDAGAGRLLCGKPADIDAAGAFASKTLMSLHTDAMVTLELLPQHARGMLKMAPLMLGSTVRDPVQSAQVGKLIDMLLDTRALRASLTPDAAALSMGWRMDVDAASGELSKRLGAAALATGAAPAEFDALSADSVVALGSVRTAEDAEDSAATKSALAQLGLPAELVGTLLQAADGPGKVISYTLRVSTPLGEPVAVVSSTLDEARDLRKDTELGKKAAAAIKGKPYSVSPIGAWAGSSLPSNALRMLVKIKSSAKAPSSFTLASVYDGARMVTFASSSTKSIDAAYTELKAPATTRLGDNTFVQAARKGGAKQVGAVRIDSLVEMVLANKAGWTKAVAQLREQQAESVAPLTWASYTSGPNTGAKAFSLWGDISVPGNAIDAVFSAAKDKEVW